MKLTRSLLFTALLLASCQSITQPSLSPAPQSIQSMSQSGAFRPLPLGSELKKELALPDEEPTPRNGNVYNDSWIQKTVGPNHTRGHSYYFNFLYQGQSSIEHILQNDGHSQAASYVKHWRKVLAENAFWPDLHSTTYNGPWPALEHGEYNNRGDGWFWFKSNSTKAEEYYQRAFNAYKKGLPANHPDQKEAWEWLGRSTHFIQDMTIPFHTKSLARPAQWFFHNPYEESCAERFHTYLPSENHNPYNVWEKGPYPKGETWGIYFPKRASAGDMIRFAATQSGPFYKLVNEREKATKGNWEKSRAVLVPMGAKLTTGLIHAFLTDVGAL